MAGREPLVWGDVPGRHPDLLGELPDGVTVCEWGYEDNHPFAERAARLAARRRPVLDVPGHLELDVDLGPGGEHDGQHRRGGRRAGRDHGATGMLTTDWGDMGHHQQPVVSEPGLAAAAAFSWCAEAHADLDDPGAWPPCSTPTPSTTRPAPPGRPWWPWAGSPGW